MNSSEIRRLASEYGIAPDYEDARGEMVNVDPEVLSLLLSNMGVLPKDSADVSQYSLSHGLLPPAIVARAERGQVAIDLNGAIPPGKIAWQIDFESGERRWGEAEPTRDGEELPYQLILTNVPFGYHQLFLEALNAGTLLIVTPGRCWLPDAVQDGRGFGISLQLYLLRSERNWGIGDFGDLAEFAKVSARHGCDVLGLNPLHQMFLDAPEHASPYSPASRRYINVLYINVAAVDELRRSERARAYIESSDFKQHLELYRSASLVDYSGVAQLKLHALRLIHADFSGCATPSRLREFGGFVRDGGHSLHSSSLFQALRDHFAGDDPAEAEWRRWPEAFRCPSSAEVAQFARDHQGEVEFYSWLQWIADQQLADANNAAANAGMQIGLYRDLAVGCDHAGSETWSSPTDYIAATAVGAPPDIFNPAGQNWGLPPFNPLALRREAYRPFIELVQANMRHAGGLRIDHVMGLQRLYCIPDGLPSSLGAYISYPLNDLIGILALESHRQRCLVVGEDLGTVPAGFRERMTQANILSYRVLFFEQDEQGDYNPPQNYPPLSVAVAGNHDLPTLRGWLAGTDIELKDRLGLYPSADETDEQVAMRQRQRAAVLSRLGWQGAARPISPQAFSEAVHRFLGRTRSVLALTQLDDLLDEHDPVNVPATSLEHPNWRRRYAEPIERLTADHPAWRLFGLLAADRRTRKDDNREPTISAKQNV